MALLMAVCFLGFLGISNAANPTWIMETEGIATIALNIACPDANTCYLPVVDNGSGAALLKSTDGCQTFTPCNVTLLPIELILFDVAARGNGVVVSLLGDNVYSTDGGVTFQNSKHGGMAQSVKAVGSSGTEYIMAGEFSIKNLDGLGISTNGGASWTYVDANLSTAANDGAYPTMTTWYIAAGETPPPPPPPPPPPAKSTGITAAPSVFSQLARKHRVFARGGPLDQTRDMVNPPPANKYVAQIAKTTDAGKTWTSQFFSQGAFEFSYIDCSPSNENHCCALGYGDTSTPPISSEPGTRIHCTTDGGATWPRTYWAPEPTNPKQAPIALSQLQFVDDNTIWSVGGYAANFGGAIFLLSTDGGKTWAMQPNKIIGLAIGMDMVSASLGFATVINTVTQQTGVASYGGKGPAPPSPAPPAPPGESHYGDPNAGPCLKDEISVSINGIKGKVCSPHCSKQTPCPTDYPSGTGKVEADCVLEANGSQTPTNCVLICDPSQKPTVCPPKATCKSIQGTGICTYNS